MGSSIPVAQAAFLAVVFGLLYLCFDAGRFFLHHVSPVKLRQWSGNDPRFAIGSRWFQYNKQHFSLVTGILLQVSMIAAIAMTVVALSHYGIGFAVAGSAIIWGLVSVGWKFVLATISEEMAEEGVRYLIPVSHVFYFLLWPLLFPLRALLKLLGEREENDEDEEVTDEEVQAYIDVGEEEGILEEGEGKLLQSIVEFGDRIAREVMTPRVDLYAIGADAGFEELVEMFDESKFSRLAVYENDIDHVIGFVHIKDAFAAIREGRSPSIRDITRPALFVSETKKVSELLREFQIERQQIAIVIDEFGGTAGIISIEDLLEEIVGEILDEHEDPEIQSWVEIDEGVYLVSGLMKIEDLEELTGEQIEVEEDDFETVAGLVFKETGRVPKIGEQVRRGSLTLAVDRADRKRIYRVKVAITPDDVKTGESIA
ncbi:MAG: hemolysin family protein [Thermoanaerobaculia bacterium]|nr:hemolysin family protein [Thermoanaerobaculia bacterium]